MRVCSKKVYAYARELWCQKASTCMQRGEIHVTTELPWCFELRFAQMSNALSLLSKRRCCRQVSGVIGELIARTPRRRSRECRPDAQAFIRGACARMAMSRKNGERWRVARRLRSDATRWRKRCYRVRCLIMFSVLRVRQSAWLPARVR